MSEICVAPRKTLCKNCGDKAQVVLDYHVGDLVCTTCGLVLEGGCLDDAAEWRNFAPEGVGDAGDAGRDRGDRQGARLEFEDEAMGTSIPGSTVMAKSLQRVHQMADLAADRGPASAAKAEAKTQRHVAGKVREITSRLGLGDSIVNRCLGLWQDLAGSSPGRMAKQASWYCALVHIATLQERATRTVRELAEANAPAAGKREADFEKQIDKKVKEINKVLGLSQPAAYVEDQDLMARFVNRLQLAPQVCRPASHIAMEAYKYGLVGRQPQTAIVASSILIVAWLLNVEQKPRFTDVATIAKVSEASVRGAYKSIRPAASRLLPKDFVCRLPGGLQGLPAP